MKRFPIIKAFENGCADKYLFPGGFYSFVSTSPLRLEGPGEVSSFHYHLTDHLGNNRVVVNDNGDIEQTTHYYPFGAVYGDAGKNPDFQKFKYTGKELDLTHGLNTYDHGARQNYSILGVWDRVDPLAEKYYNVNPYSLCNNNPILLIDPTGTDWAIDSLGNAHYNASWDENNKLPTGYKYFGKSGQWFKELKNGITTQELGDNGSVNDLYFVEDIVVTPSHDYSVGLSAFSWTLQSQQDLFDYGIRDRLGFGWKGQQRLEQFDADRQLRIHTKAIGRGGATYYKYLHSSLKIMNRLGVAQTILDSANDLYYGRYASLGTRIAVNTLIYSSRYIPYVGPFVSAG